MNDESNPQAVEAYWKEQVEAWKHTDMSQAKFCQDNGLIYHRFGYWCRKFNGATEPELTKRNGGGFTAVNPKREVDCGLSLSLPNGLVMRGIRAENLPVVRQLLDQL